MAQLPNKPKRIPRLSPLQLQATLLRLEALGISKQAKQALRGMLQTAANPDGQQIDVVVRALERERQMAVADTARTINNTTRTALLRAANSLLNISNDEWENMVNDANTE